jgi:hypothetical protein
MRHGIARIHSDIENRQLELTGVDLDRRDVRRHVGDDLDVAPQRAAQQIGDDIHLLVHVDDLRLEGLTAREGQQLLGQLLAALHRVTHVAEDALELLVVAAQPLRHVGPAENDGQKIVEVMRDAPGQLADRLHLLGLE